MFLKEGEIFFNGKYSQQDLGLRIENYPDIPLSYENYDVENDVYMRKSPFIVNNGTFNNKEVSFVFTKNSDEDILNFDDIYDWLLNVKDNRFIYGLEDRCLIYKKAVFGDFKQEFRTFGTITITFILSPFWEDIQATKYTITSNNFRFRYSGTATGEPYIKLYGSGNIQLTINEETMVINNLNNYVIIDSENMKIVDSNGNSKEFDSTGNFFELEQGKYIVSYTGNVTKIELTYRNKWRG